MATSATIARIVNPLTNPTAYLSAAGAVYAAATMIYNAVNHHGVINTSVILAAVTAVAALFIRSAVTPIRSPKDGAGRSLVPADVWPTFASGGVVRSGVGGTGGTTASGSSAPGGGGGGSTSYPSGTGGTA